MTITLTCPSAEMQMVSESWILDVPPAPDGPTPAVYTYGVFMPDGTLVRWLPDAVPGEINDRMNEWGDLSVTIPKSDVLGLAACKRWTRELHCYRNGRWFAGGPIDSWKGNGKNGGRVVTALGPLAYLAHKVRVAEEVAQVNFFRNWHFVDGLEGWTGRTPTGVTGPTEATLDPDSETGDQSALLEDGASISQPVLFTEFHFDFTLEVSARVKIDAGCSPGVLITVDIPGVSATAGYTSASVTEDTPRGIWTTVKCQVAVDGATQPTIAVFPAFHALDGGPVLVDHVVATVVNLREVLSDEFGIDIPEGTGPQLDYGRIAANIVTEAGAPFNLGVDSPAVGQLTVDDKGVPKLAWEPIKAAVDQEVYDVWLAASRYVRTVKFSAPRMGRDIDPDELTLHWDTLDGVPANCDGGYDAAIEASNPRSRVYAVSDAGVGVADDPDGYGGEGVVFEDVISAPSELTTIDQVNGWARTNLANDDGTAHDLKLSDIDGALWWTLGKGDRVRVVGEDYDYELDAVCRVIDRSMDAAFDRFAVTLNLEPV